MVYIGFNKISHNFASYIIQNEYQIVKLLAHCDLFFFQLPILCHLT